jgi:hypothetical protein
MNKLFGKKVEVINMDEGITENGELVPIDAVKQQGNTDKKIVGKPFEKGDSRINRAGRPPSGKAIAEKARSILKSPSPDNPDLLVEDIILQNIVADALSGSLQSSVVILNRAYGRDTEHIMLGKEEQEIDYSVLSDEELNMMMAIMEKAEHGETAKYHYHREIAKGRTDIYDLTKEIEEKYGKIEGGKDE